MARGENRALGADLRFRRRGVPRPRIAEPQLGKHVQFGGFGAAIVDRYLRQDIVRTSLEILNENIPVAILIEYAGVDQFEFVVVQTAIAIFLYQPARRGRQPAGTYRASSGRNGRAQRQGNSSTP